MDPLACAKTVFPAQTHFLQGRRFRFFADQRWVTRAMGLAKGMATGNQGDSLFIIHRHAGESFAHIAARADRVRIAVGAFGIHVNQAHLDGGQRIFEVALTTVALVAEPI